MTGSVPGEGCRSLCLDSTGIAHATWSITPEQINRRECRTRWPPILISLTCTLRSDQCLTALGRHNRRRKFPRLYARMKTDAPRLATNRWHDSRVQFSAYFPCYAEIPAHGRPPILQRVFSTSHLDSEFVFESGTFEVNKRWNTANLATWTFRPSPSPHSAPSVKNLADTLHPFICNTTPVGRNRAGDSQLAGSPNQVRQPGAEGRSISGEADLFGTHLGRGSPPLTYCRRVQGGPWAVSATGYPGRFRTRIRSSCCRASTRDSSLNIWARTSPGPPSCTFAITPSASA